MAERGAAADDLEQTGQASDATHFSRRTVVASMMAVATTSRAEAGAGPHERVDKAAAELAAAMRGLHGGRWRVRVDHDARLVVIISA